MLELEVITALSTLSATILALLSLCWSIYVSKMLMKQNSDELILSIMPKSNIHNPPINSTTPPTNYTCLKIKFRSPQQRKTQITHFCYRVYKTKLHYYAKKIPLVRKLIKDSGLLIPTKFFTGGVSSLFVNGIVNLEDGKEAMFLKPNDELIKELELEKRNVLEFQINATPEYFKKIHMDVSDIFD